MNEYKKFPVFTRMELIRNEKDIYIVFSAYIECGSCRKIVYSYKLRKKKPNRFLKKWTEAKVSDILKQKS
ncbi:hypothetical protein UP17_14220 [Peribacillus simplex]|nr:hypothetical protein UP17_14220 [Peribacillus simplex]